MIKKLLLLLFLGVSSLPITARQRTLSEMQNEAQSVLTISGARAQTGGNALQVIKQKEMLTVLGNGSQFAIIANDDAYRAVVGYADGTYTANNSTLTWFIDAVNEAMVSEVSVGVMHRTSVAPDASKFKIYVEPLLQTTWSQREPYNNLCPKTSSGSAYPSGCVATALSQIMKYHAYPTNGIGEKQYSFKPADGVGELLYANFGATTYEWDKMLDNYVSGSYSDEEANAVATIMLHCGVSVEMNYTTSGSGAYSSEACNGLVKFFGYNANIGIVYRDYYSLEQWMAMVYAELNKQRPIYYAGSDNSRGGHAFVIDGYDATGLVHVNWGWGADGGNGYFDITLLNPTGYQFSGGQNMLLGIDLPTADIAYESHLVSDYAMTVSKMGVLLNVNVGQSIWNLNGDAWEGELAVVLEGEGQTYELSKGNVSKTANLYNVLSNTSPSIGGMLKLPTGIADGNYRLFVGARNSRDSRWQLVRRSKEQVNCYLATISNGAISSLTSETDDTWRGTVTGISSVRFDDSHSSYLYDITGRKVNDTNQPGIYIRNGQKIIK